MSSEIFEDLAYRPLVCAVDGTHAAGKTTLVESFGEQGKLQDLMRELTGKELPYDDLGYGLLDLPPVDSLVPAVFVPETARWAADYSDDPTLLGENWNLEFQLQLTEKYKTRIQTAVELAGLVAHYLTATTPDLETDDFCRPLVLTDRSGLDGLAYTRLRASIEGSDLIGGFPSAGASKKWTAYYIDLVLLADHSDVPFEPDPARSNDLQLREDVAAEVEADYRSILPPERIGMLQGNLERRQQDLARFIAPHICD